MRSILYLTIAVWLSLIFTSSLHGQACNQITGLEILKGDTVISGQTLTVCTGDNIVIESNILFGLNGESSSYLGGPDDMITYNWTRDGQVFPNIDAGGNFMIDNITADFAGVYQLVFNADCDGGADAMLMDNFTLVVVELETPVIQVNCDGGDVVLSVENLPPSASVMWSGPGNISSDSTDWTLPGNAGEGTYSVTISVGDCMESATQEIDPQNIGGIAEPTFTPNGPEACVGETINVTAISAEAISYSWSTGAMGATAPLPPGNHSVTVTNADGCSSSASVLVGSRNRLPRPTVMAADNAICPGETTVLTASGSGSGVTYVWNTGAMTASITVGPGVYSVSATQTGECASLVRSQTVTELNAPDISIDEDPEIFCEGDTVELTVIGEPGAQTFNWSTTETTRSIMVDMSGTYSVTLMSANGCDGFAEITIDPPLPIPDLPIQLGTTINAGQVTNIPVDLGNQDIDNLSWSLISEQFVNLISAPNGVTFANSFPAGASSNSGQNRSVGALLYAISVETDGCESAPVELLVRVLPDAEEPFIPQIVSPNNDGSNDEWAVLFPNPDATYEIMVYSRGGGVVFNGTQAQLPWDTGECPNGTYYYQIRQTNGDGLWQGALSIIGRQ